MNKNKAAKKIALLTAVVAIVIGLIFAFSGDGQKVPEGSNFKIDTYDNMVEKYRNGEEGIYYFGYLACPACQMMEPIVDEALKEIGEEAWYVDLDTKGFKERHFMEILDADTIMDEENQSHGAVPLVVIINKDKDRKSSMPILNLLTEENQDSENIEEFIKVRLVNLMKETLK